MRNTEQYHQFLESKVKLAQNTGFELDLSEINPAIKPHNKLMVKWAVNGGRRAVFASFGLHKTVTQLEIIRCVLLKTGGRGLIIAPLGVKAEFQKDAVNILGWESGPKFIRRIEEADATGIYITNYETVRDGKLDPRLFEVACLDEASILRGFGGSKTFREFMRLFTGDAGPMGDRRGTEIVPYRFVATATPSPNDYIELLAYADFLGVMDVSQAKTRFFKRDSTKADKLTLHKHKEEEFWLWVASWALFVTKPSDLTGNPADDEGYILPELDLRWHEIPSDHSTAGVEKNGQGRLFKNVAIGLGDAAKEKNESLARRIEKMMELRLEDISAHRILWHDLEAERMAIERAIPGVATVFGKQALDIREDIISKFSNGTISEIGGKPSMIGSGTNLQRYCSWAIYLGIGFKFNDFIQSIHRLLRFLQQNQVRVDLIYTEAERQVRTLLEYKWKQHNKMVHKMVEIVKQFGLSQAAMASILTRKIGVERVEIKSDQFHIVNNDAVLEAKRLEDNSIGLVLTSWPFSNQYEYSPNYSDFGHNSSNSDFFKQMDFLTPEVFRSLMPGRDAFIHVKDRITPGGMTKFGFQTVYPFHMDAISHMTKHGFGFMGMKSIVTDVVRENKQTNRLGWTEQCKDGSKMGFGMSEYLLMFRKPTSDPSNGYADTPVVKQKKYFDRLKKSFAQGASDGDDSFDDNNDESDIVFTGSNKWINPDGYSRARWQTDAHGFARSSGNRLLLPEEFTELNHKQISRIFRKYTMENVYDYEYHVAIGEALEATGKLPSGFMLLQPQSWDENVWTDITRMRTLNGKQQQTGKEMHLCPFQIDTVRRVIKQNSNPGDKVLDYFGGIMTVPAIAVEEGRYGVAFELSPSYFLDGAVYCRAAESKQHMPTLFDLLENEAA